MAVLIASNLRKEFSGDPLFEEVSFTVDRRNRLSLAGPNGAGKTTLLRAIAGETSLQGGDLAFAKGTRVALHDQRPPRRYSDAQARLEHAGGWAWRDRAARAVRGLGFRDDDLDRPLDTFSGGELTRASLARALAVERDLLLLDEPTNPLDVESLEWLEGELGALDAAVVLVAHDRWFLEAITTAVLELSPGWAHFFAGPWHDWRREKAARAIAAEKTADRVSEDIARLERFVARFRYKKSKAKQAQAKLTQIGRLEVERSAARDELASLTRKRRTLGFDFLNPPRTGRVVLEAEDIVLSAGDKKLLEGASLVLERGEKVALVGPNGSGKTTLLEAILGQRELDAGTTRLGHGVVPAYFSQHTQELPTSGSVLDAAVKATGLNRPQAQTLLGRFLFSGWETHEREVVALSGGERRRLVLALLVASGANLLVLDEPTNHLDLESREALEAALEAFPGTVLIVSHDRALLDAVPDRIVALEDRSLRSYDGGWADLERERSAQALSAAPKAPKNIPGPQQNPTRRKPRSGPTQLELVEAQIAAVEARVSELERRLADDWANMDVLAAHRASRDELEALLGRWEALFDAAGER